MASVLLLAWRAGIGGPWAVTRGLLSGLLRYVGPMEEGSAGPRNEGARNETAMAPFRR